MIFNYLIQAEVDGKTRLGRDVSFPIEATLVGKLPDDADLTKPVQIIPDLDGDFVADTLPEILQSQLSEYCLRYGVIEKGEYAPVYRSFIIESQEHDVLLHFGEDSRNIRTTEADAKIYATYLDDSAAPEKPSDVNAQVRGESIILSWIPSGHHHGIHIYSDSDLLATLGEGVSEWTHLSPEKGKAYTYEIALYNANHESERASVSIYMPNDVLPPLPPTGSQARRSPVYEPETDMNYFQSGTGGGDDLEVFIPYEVSEEEFGYTIQLKGYTEETVRVFPEYPFRYQISVTEQDGYAPILTMPWRIGYVNGDGLLDHEGAGKRPLRLKMEDEVPGVTPDYIYDVTIDDPQGHISYQLEGIQEGDTSEIYLVFSSDEAASEERKVKKSHYGSVLPGKGRYTASGKSPAIIHEEIDGLMYHEELAKVKDDLVQLIAIVKADNDNVEIQAEIDQDRIQDRFIPVRLKANVQNPTQASWVPDINSGYYYFGQSERHLYGESNVHGGIQQESLHPPLIFSGFIDITMNDGETYTEELQLEVLSDGELHQVYDRPIRSITEDVLLENGKILSLVEEQIASITVHAGEAPVVLSSRSSIEAETPLPPEEAIDGKLYAHTTGESVEYLYKEMKLAVENHVVYAYPLPRLGSPIIVIDDTGREMNQVFFTDDKGNPTLDFKETLESNGYNEIHLPYIDVDPDSISVYPVHSPEQKVDAFVSENIVYLYPDVPPYEQYVVEGRISRSFIAEPGEGANEGSIKLTMHGEMILNADSTVKVIYETGEGLYRSKDTELNPLRTGRNEGFLYIAKDVEPPSRIELRLPEFLNPEGMSKHLIKAYVYDRVGNPVINEEVLFHAEKGVIHAEPVKTNTQGIASVPYQAPAEVGKDEITVIGTLSGLEAKGELTIREDRSPKRISIMTNHPTVYPGLNEITVTTHVFGEDQEPLSGVPLKYEFTDNALFDVDTGKTDAFGRHQVHFVATDIPRTGIIRVKVKAESIGLSEETVVRILGFRDYDPDFFVASNNLIDLYDREGARENLGVFAGSSQPAEGLESDLWLDQGDVLYLTQSYNLRDVKSPEETRKHLGVHIHQEEPEELTAYDVWFDYKEGDD